MELDIMNRRTFSVKVAVIVLVLCQSACELYDGAFIEGCVLDAINDRPVLSACVSIYRSGYHRCLYGPPIAETITGFEGGFQLAIPEPEDNYVLVVSKDGYCTISLSFDLMCDQYFEIALERTADEYD